MTDFNLTLADTHVVVAPEKALFLPDHAAWLVSDLHFGKAAHFRKHGIRVPAETDMENLARLDALLVRYPAKRLVLAGDAFHSEENRALALFSAWRERHAGLSIELVKGNHDVMAAATYRQLGVIELGKEARLGTLAIVHDPADAGTDPTLYYLAGHVHPGVYMPSAGAGLTLPALVLGQRSGLLPCFGGFTGLAAVDARQAERVLVFSKTRVYELPRTATA